MTGATSAARLSARRAAAPARTPPAPRALATWALRLAGGRAPAEEIPPSAWPALRDFARRERLSSLAWIRSSREIEERADAATASAWRRDWLGTSVRSLAVLSLARELTAAAEAASVPSPVVLKGGPLAHRLYGDAGARPSTDLDLYVEPEARPALHAAALSLGWRHVDGSDFGGRTYVRSLPDGEVYLELHASLLGERMTHLAVPAPQGRPVVVDGMRLVVHDDALLPGYLAAHLASHTLPPLLWWLDWHSLWTSLDDAARAEASAAASSAGLERYLGWARRRAAAVGEALDGDDRALGRLGYRVAGERRDVHASLRHVRLAPSVRAGAAAARQWIRPSWADARDGGIVVGTLRRAARHWRLLLPASPPTAGRTDGQDPTVRVADAGQLLSVARGVVGAGGEMWLGVTGRSMTPTIAEGDSVFLSGVEGAPRPGDVVLAAAAGGPLLHRVVRAEGGVVVTRGDACVTTDAAVPAFDVVARALAVRRGSVVATLAPTLRFGVGPLLRYWVRTVRASRRRTTPAGRA